MTKTRVLAIAGTAHLIVAILLSLMFLTGRPVPAAGSAVGFTSTFTPIPSTDTPVPPPTDTPVSPPTDTPIPPPTDTPESPPPSEPEPTVPPTPPPTSTPAPILPLSGGGTDHSFAVPLILGGVVLLLGWLLRHLIVGEHRQS